MRFSLVAKKKKPGKSEIKKKKIASWLFSIRNVSKRIEVSFSKSLHFLMDSQISKGKGVI